MAALSSGRLFPFMCMVSSFPLDFTFFDRWGTCMADFVRQPSYSKSYCLILTKSKRKSWPYDIHVIGLKSVGKMSSYFHLTEPETREEFYFCGNRKMTINKE